MKEKDSKLKATQTPENNIPANLPGVEVTDSNETTQQVPQKPPIKTSTEVVKEAPLETPPAPSTAESIQKEAVKLAQAGLKDEVINDNLEDIIKSAPVPSTLDKVSDEAVKIQTLEDVAETTALTPTTKDVVSEKKEIVFEKEAKLSEPTEGVDKESKLKSLRTYKGDLAKVMGTRDGSLVGIASAESDKRYKLGQKEPVVVKGVKGSGRSFAKKFTIIALSTLLVVLGVGSVFYFYGKSNLGITIPNPKAASIIFADEDFEFNITDLSKRQILNELTSIKDNTNISIGRIRNIFITESLVDEKGFEKSSLVSTSNFLDAVEVSVPTSFSRSLRPEFMIGVHVFDGNQPFIILRTNFYENAFVGMLGWEVNMQDNLSPLFDSGKRASVLPTKNTTSTPGLKSRVFSDLVIKNKDARVLKDEKGDVSLIYSFIDKQTIVITTNTSTFGEVFARLTSSRTLR